MVEGIDASILISIIGAAITFGAAWGGVRYSLNGFRKSVFTIEDTVKRIDEYVQENRRDIAVLKVKTESLRDGGCAMLQRHTAILHKLEDRE